MFKFDKNAQKCPNFMNAITELNESLFPKLPQGISTTVNMDVGKLFGNARSRTTSLLFTNRFDMYTSNRNCYEFGFSYNNRDTRDFPADGAVQAILEGNTFGEVKGHVNCKVTNNLTFYVWGQRELDGSTIISVLDWSGNRHNVNVELIVSPEIRRNLFSMNHMYRINDRWSIGNYFVTNKDTIFGFRGARWPSYAKPVHFYSALRYDGDRETITAMVDRAANTTLQYQHRVNDTLTVGAEVTADVTHKTATMTWLHRTTLNGGLEIRGRLDTDGLVVGHLNKVVVSNNRGSLVVGITTSLNHKYNSIGIGLETELNIGTETKEND